MSPEDLVLISIEELLTRPDEQFEKTVDYVLQKNAEVYQRLAGYLQESLETASILWSNGPALDVGGEEAEHFAEGEVGVAGAGVGVAVPAGDEEVGMLGLGAAGEFCDEGGLAGAGLAGDEADLAVACLCRPGRQAGQGAVEERLESR